MDLMLEWGGDLQLTPSGSVAAAVGWDEIRERIIRRILTNPTQRLPDGTTTQADYIFDQTYGIGGGSLVSQNPTRRFIVDLKKRIRAGIMADAAVDPGFDPQILIRQPTPNTFTIYVGVVLTSGSTGQFSVTTAAPSTGGIFTLDQSLLDSTDVLG